MAAAAILKNRKIAISRPRFDGFRQNLARRCSLAILSVPTVKIYKKRAHHSLNAGPRTALPLTENTSYTSQQCPVVHGHSHVHVVSGTLQSVGHLLLKAAPLAEYSAVVGMQLVQSVLLVTQSLQTRQQITAMTTTGPSN